MSQLVKPLTLVHPTMDASIEFVWTDDRFDHAIRLGPVKLQSLCGPPDECWPDSPPIQQLSIETLEGRPVALGVGGAGTSHWSLSVEPVESGFRFDWACRAKSTPERLGTTYASDSHLNFKPGEETVVGFNDGRVDIQPGHSMLSSGSYRWQYQAVVR